MIGREKYRFWIVIVRLVYEIQKFEDDYMDKWVNIYAVAKEVNVRCDLSRK
jgi:hypothetical protein